jgi:hypothetical protein
MQESAGKRATCSPGLPWLPWDRGGGHRLSGLSCRCSCWSGPSWSPPTRALAWIATERSNQEIAEELFLSPATVRTHISRAMGKLGARDRAQLVGFAVVEEPRRPFAVIVEGLAAVVLALGASAVLTRRTWAWAAATGAQAVALAGVVRGMVAIAAGRGPHTQLNDTYHRVMVVVLGAGRSCCWRSGLSPAAAQAQELLHVADHGDR